MKRNLLAVAAALLLLAASPHQAESGDTFGLEPARGLARAMSQAAGACYECGEKARELKLHSWARSFYDHALRYNPEHRPTRRVLGFRKSRGTWVQEEDPIPTTDEVNEAERQGQEAKLIADTLSIRREAADAFWPFAESSRMPLEQRMLALFHTIRLCPEHREGQRAARANRGDLFYKHWLDDESDSMRQRWIQSAPEGTAIDENTPYMMASGYKMDARRGEWIVVHSFMATSEDWALAMMRYAEAARERSVELLGLPEREPPAEDAGRLHYTVFRTRAHFAKFLETCSNIQDASKRAEIAKVGYGAEVYKPYGAVYLSPVVDDQGPVRDAIAHDIGSKAIVRHTGWNTYWLARGFGYYCSTQMNGSVAQQFYGVQTSAVVDSGGHDALPGFGRSAATWRLLVAMEAAAGTAMPLSELVAARPADYKRREIAHAFSFAEFLIAEHKPALAKFLQSAQAEVAKRAQEKKDNETGPEQMQRLLQCLELSEEDFNKAHAAWVLEEYVRLGVED